MTTRYALTTIRRKQRQGNMRLALNDEIKRDRAPRRSPDLQPFGHRPKACQCAIAFSTHFASKPRVSPTSISSGLASSEKKTSPQTSLLHDTMIFWKLNVRMQLHKPLNAKGLAPRARFELATLRLTAECSTIELPGIRTTYLFSF